MRHQFVIALSLLVSFACVDFTSAMIGAKVSKYCKESMGNATTHKVFCRAISNRVTLKAYKVCRKGVTWSCKTARLTGVDYKSCKTTLLEYICPNVDALTSTVAPTTILPDGSAPVSTSITNEETDDFPDDDSDEDDSDEDDSDEDDNNELLQTVTPA